MDALISGRTGVAVVLEGDQIASIHAAEPERTVVRSPHELHFLVGEGRDFVAVEAVSRDEIVRHLKLAADREDSLQLAMILLDSEMPQDIRREAAFELEELLADEDLVAALEDVLYAAPLPEVADLVGGMSLASGAGAARALALLDRLRIHQTAIDQARRAWEAVPPKTFAGAKEQWQATAVRNGLFRKLILSRFQGKQSDDIFFDAAQNLPVRSLPNHRRILQTWIRSFLEHYDVRARPFPRDPQPAVVHDPEGVAEVATQSRSLEFNSEELESSTSIDQPQAMDEATHLLTAWRHGDQEAFDRLMTIMQDELRSIAQRYMVNERSDHILEPMALVNEIYLRIASRKRVSWKNIAQFRAFAATTMRRVLVDHARQRQAGIRNEGVKPLPIDELRDLPADRDSELIAIDEALMSLAKINERQLRVVELHYFGALSCAQIAEDLGISESAVKRALAAGRAWLRRELRSSER